MATVKKKKIVDKQEKVVEEEKVKTVSSYKNIEPYKWKKGQSGNPNGRPPLHKTLVKKSLSELQKWIGDIGSVMDDPDMKHPLVILIEMCNDKKLAASKRMQAARYVLPYLVKPLSTTVVQQQDNSGQMIQVNMSVVNAENQEAKQLADESIDDILTVDPIPAVPGAKVVK